ncbi:MAG: YIP1 family protein [Defluviitaleaceae bacterium]|jgi:hypothetical protein|nr:YIP1 family protein [Defluviitaleaceae bacterium]
MMATEEKKQRSSFLSTAKEIMITFPLFILTSPFKGFDEMKYQKRGDMRYSIIILLLAGLVRIIRVTSTGFVMIGYNITVPYVNVPGILILFYAPILLIVLANWSITTLTNGKGSFRNIFQVYTYALFPTIFLHLAAVGLSHVVTANEAFFVGALITLSTVLLYGYLFVGLIVVHEYTFFRAVLMVILTILAMLIIIFIVALFLSLLNNFVGFVWIFAYELQPHFGR